MHTTTLSPRERRSAVWEGGLSAGWAALEGGVFLAGFALLLGAGHLHQGLLAALPFMAGVAQLVAAYVMDVHGVSRRKIAIWGLAGSRLAFLLVVPAAWVLMPASPESMLTIFLIAAAIAYGMQSAAGVAWLSWIADRIPDGERGRFFAARNLFAGVVTMASLLAGAWWLSSAWGKALHPQGGYLILFTFAGILGLVGSRRLASIVDAAPPARVAHRAFWGRLQLSTVSPGFRRFLLFHVLYMSAVYLASPFFAFFFLENGLTAAFIAKSQLVMVATSITSVQLWGVFCDRFGAKPVLYVTFSITSFIPILYWLPSKEQLPTFVYMVQALSGFAWSGGALAASQLLLKVMPRSSSTTSLAVFGAVSGVATAVAPLLGGFALEFLENMNLRNDGMWHYRFLFFASFLLRGGALLLLGRVPEVDGQPTREVVRALSTWRTLYSVTGLELLRFHFIQPLRALREKRKPAVEPPETLR